MQLCLIQSNSVLYILTTPVKRLFSIAVKVLHRRLTDKTFEMLMFVRCNESMLRAQKINRSISLFSNANR